MAPQLGKARDWSAGPEGVGLSGVDGVGGMDMVQTLAEGEKPCQRKPPGGRCARSGLPSLPEARYTSG
ncbi:MAG: hypothetical protein ACREI3_06955 [Nitrospirales bacterium]